MKYIRRCETPTLTTGRDFSQHPFRGNMYTAPVIPEFATLRTCCARQPSNARPTTTWAITLTTWTVLTNFVLDGSSISVLVFPSSSFQTVLFLCRFLLFKEPLFPPSFRLPAFGAFISLQFYNLYYTYKILYIYV